MTRTRRLAIVSTMSGSPWGGSEELWAAAARVAKKRGWQVMASVTDASAPQHRTLRADGVDVREHLVVVPWSARLQSAAGRVVSPLRHVAWFKPDVVLLSQGTTYELASNHLLARAILDGPLQETPLVVVCHLNFDEPPPATSRQRARQFFLRARTVFFVAERNLRQARRHLADDIANGAVIRNPVNLSSLEALDPAPVGPVARFASVARLDTRFKGQDMLFEALAGERWRSRQWELSIYGSGGDEQYLRDLAGFYGLMSRIQFKGHVSNVRDIWRREEILVLASRAEGTPLALVEAMICGRPAIVTRVAGNDEWVTEGETGFVAEAPTVESIRETLDRALAARSAWADMGRRAREAAMERIDPRPGETLFGVLADVAERGPGVSVTRSVRSSVEKTSST